MVLVWSTCSVVSLKSPVKVVIAGAGSSVGFLVFQKLLKSQEFYPVGLVRDKAGFDALKRLKVNDDQIRICDITVRDSLQGVFDGAGKAVICTTSTPKKRLRYKIKSVFRWMVGRGRPPRVDELYYDKNQRPYEVDFLGQKNLVDECVEAEVDHVVLLGSMGGYRGSKVNEIGRQSSKDAEDVRNGNVLKWKRAAERYLIKRRLFTILHAGVLTDEAGGQREVVWDTDDALLLTPFKKIPREDVAEVIVQALIYREAIGRSIDIAAGPADGNPTTDWLRFWSRPGDCVYPADFGDLGFK